MDPLEHLRIGTVALKLGLLDAAALGDAMRAVTSGDLEEIEPFWIGRGLLTVEQLVRARALRGRERLERRSVSNV